MCAVQPACFVWEKGSSWNEAQRRILTRPTLVAVHSCTLRSYSSQPVGDGNLALCAAPGVVDLCSLLRSFCAQPALRSWPWLAAGNGNLALSGNSTDYIQRSYQAGVSSATLRERKPSRVGWTLASVWWLFPRSRIKIKCLNKNWPDILTGRTFWQLRSSFRQKSSSLSKHGHGKARVTYREYKYWVKWNWHLDRFPGDHPPERCQYLLGSCPQGCERGTQEDGYVLQTSAKWCV